jgi:opacity protein-like surface antigen
MKSAIVIAVSALVIFSAAFAESADLEGFQGRPIINNVWMQTGYSLNKGEFIIGIGPIGFGITDNIQVGTNILLFIIQYYNANVKVSLLKTDKMGFALGLDYGHFNLDVFGAETSFTTYSPFATLSANLSPSTAVHFGGQYTSFSADAEIEDADLTATSSGSSLSGGIEYSVSNKTKFLAEAGYDITFEGMRYGGAVLFGWQKLRIKLGVSVFNPKGGETFTWPVIGIWWRFKG